jgi:hypothetical protein
MPLINALRRAQPSVPLENRTQPSGCRGSARHLRRRARRENQQLLPLISCGTTPGGVKFYPTCPGETATVPAYALPRCCAPMARPCIDRGGGLKNPTSLSGPPLGQKESYPFR